MITGCEGGEFGSIYSQSRAEDLWFSSRYEVAEHGEVGESFIVKIRLDVGALVIVVRVHEVERNRGESGLIA